jgi:hypothetical protein
MVFECSRELQEKIPTPHTLIIFGDAYMNIVEVGIFQNASFFLLLKT